MKTEGIGFVNQKKEPMKLIHRLIELRGQDLNLRPRGYEPRELPGCSTPHRYSSQTDILVEGKCSFFQNGLNILRLTARKTVTRFLTANLWTATSVLNGLNLH